MGRVKRAIARVTGAARAATRSRPAPVARRPSRHPRPLERPIGCAIITVSDTRRPETDRSGDALARLLADAGQRVVSRAWVRDEPAEIRRAMRTALARRQVEVVVLTGGTGVSPRDRTPEALRPLLERELPGFGELFRVRSYAEIGSRAWLSRALAGIARGRLVVALPGSTAAVTLAARELLIPELGHVARLLADSTNGA